MMDYLKFCVMTRTLVHTSPLPVNLLIHACQRYRASDGVARLGE